MRFGIFFSLQTPRPWLPDTERLRLAEALEQVELADTLGYDCAWAQEHHFLEEYAHSSAPEVFLAAASQRTRRIRLGHGIVLMPPAYNHPARVAERVAMLDLVSGGRVEWGTGESGTRIELEAFGVPYVEKRAMWEEAVREAARMMASDPYPGAQGRFFQMPPRNVVPKPLQRPHPPLWVACSNRESLKHAARHGVGAMTFAFMDPSEARYWVEEYYETFRRECRPVGRSVNPNVAMLSQFMCHEDAGTAVERGLEGALFFAYGLSHYYRTGSHVPGRTRIFEQFLADPPKAMAGNLGIGTPDEIREHFEGFERAGVDQLILLHQAGNYAHADVLHSLRVFGERVLPEFVQRRNAVDAEKAAMLEPHLDRIAATIEPIELVEPEPVDCYPVFARKHGVEISRLAQDRGVLPAAMWRMQVGGYASGTARRRRKAASSKTAAD